MIESRYEEIVEFCQELPMLRQKVSDIPLLDECQAALVELLVLTKDAPLEPDPPPVNVDVPYASGIGSVGSMLNCTMGNWQYMNVEGASYAYQWMNDGNPALNGSMADYVVVEGDRGHSMTCVVTATNDGGSTAAPPSNSIAIS